MLQFETPMSENHVEEHSSPIKTPKQLLIVVALSFLVPIALIVLLSQLLTTGLKAGDKEMSADAVAVRLQPVGQVAVTDPNAPKVEKSGKEVVEAICGACHLSGALGAPKVGDKAGWGNRIAQGLGTLTQHAIQGIRQMPARGGNPDLSDLEIGRAVAYMANQSGASFQEPAATAPAKK